MVVTNLPRVLINSKPTRSNTSTNTCVYDLVLNFLETSPLSTSLDFYPAKIASELGLNPSTVRGVLADMLKDHRVMVYPKGREHYYCATKRYSDEFTRLMKIYPVSERWELHGLTLKLEAKALGLEGFTNTLPEGGIIREHGWVGVGGLGTGETSFQLSRCTLMVYVSCSMAPLDYDGWMLWLKQVDGYLCAKQWPRLLGENFRFWVQCQTGLNHDHQKIRIDSYAQAVSLQVFDEFFARVYGKKLANGKDVVREEIHLNGEMNVEKLLQNLSGSMHSVMVDNKVEGAAEAVNNNTATLQEQKRKLVDIEKKIDLLKNNGVNLASSKNIDGSIYSLEFKLDSLRTDFVEFKQSYEGKTQRLIETNEGLSGLLKEMMAMMKGSVEAPQVPSNENYLKEDVEYVR
jgi:hypothetical protein